MIFVVDQEIKDVVIHAGVDLRNAITQKIGSNIPLPNAPSTIKAKGSSKTLIDTGAMWSSIDTQVMGESENSIEVASGIFEPDIAKYAIANEFGSVRTVTTKNKDNESEQHQGYSIIVIPERSFMRTAFDENIESIYGDMSEKIANIISKRFKE